VVFLVLAALAFREGFTRHDIHSTVFFGEIVGSLCALEWPVGRRILGVSLILIAAAAFAGALGSAPSQIVNPISRIRVAGKTFLALVDPGERATITAQGRRQIEAQAALDPAIVAALRGHPVHVEPWDTSIVWAYRLRWSPLPVYQSYDTYTAALDRVDASRIYGDGAPERILYRSGESLDGDHYPAFDGPQTTRAMLCRYRPELRRGHWLLLALVPNRCGTPRKIEETKAGWGQTVAVPAPSGPGELVYVRILGSQPTGLAWLEDELFKGNDHWITLDGQSRYRLITAVAGDGLSLRAGRGVDYAPPFRQVPQATTISIEHTGIGGSSGKPLHLIFYEQLVHSG
jgi:hypothetical protein